MYSTSRGGAHPAAAPGSSPTTAASPRWPWTACAAVSPLLYANGLHLVVLNACWTAHLAKEFSDAVPAAIGWQAEVADVHARGYARVFHRNLAGGESVTKAHATARMMLDLAGCASPPTLHTGAGRIPEAHFLIGPEARSVPRQAPLSLRYQQSGTHLRKPRFRPPPPQF